jgi:heme/copper-type cytochrome/quinol oxidase subunit 2
LDDIEDSPDLCVLHGPKIAIANMIIMLVAVFWFMICWLKCGRQSKNPQLEVNYMRLSSRVWSVIFLILLAIVFVFMITAFYVDSWVEFDNDADKIVGSLTTCNDCEDYLEKFNWDNTDEARWECLSGYM